MSSPKSLVKALLSGWLRRRELQALLAMGSLILIMGLRISSHGYDQATTTLKEIRALTRASQGRAQSQIGVKLINQSAIGEGLLSVYLTVPCEVICGYGDECERTCQRQVAGWDPARHSAPLAKYYLEFSTPQGGTLGHVFRPAKGHIRALNWSPRYRILTISHRTGQGCCESVSLYQVHADSAQRGRAAALSLKATHQLYSLSAFSAAGEPELTIDDLDEDDEPEWYLYDERLATLTPRPLKLKLPYHLTEAGLTLNSRLIRSSPPSLQERRQWILDHLKESSEPEGPTPVGLSEPLFKALIKLCVKGYCVEADELAKLAYPQSEIAQAYWLQLKGHITRDDQALIP